MHYLEHFYTKTLKHDLANKFFYRNTKKLPQLKKIVLNFGCKSTEIKNLAASLLALELIAHKKGTLTVTRHSNIILKIRKGNPVGCKVSLRKEKMFIFLEKLLTEIFPKIKSFDGTTLSKRTKKNILSYKFRDNFSFMELEEHYYLFHKLPKLDITIVTSSRLKEEMLFLIKSLQWPLKNQVY